MMLDKAKTAPKRRDTRRSGPAIWRNALVASLVVGILVFLYFRSEQFSLHVGFLLRTLGRGDLEGIRDYIRAWGAWGPAISAAVMVFQSVLAPLPSFLVTVANGFLFGAFWGGALSWSSAMVGAALCFWITRSFGRPAAERFVNPKAMARVDAFFARYGDNSILIARLIPVVSFDAVSYLAGLTPIRFWAFFLATGIGQLPATVVYSWLGQNVTGMTQLWLYVLLILAALTVLALTVRKAMQLRAAARKQRVMKSELARDE
jgi:uncharacterized membrane protein YdjX (TVP38/TMEM64 family)